MSSPFQPPWVSVVADRVQWQRALASKEEQEAAGAFELRLDLWPHAARDEAALRELREEVLSLRQPVVVTWRTSTSPEATGLIARRTDFVRHLLSGGWGAAWIDLDLEDDRDLLSIPRGREVSVIGSKHARRSMSDAAAHRCLDEGFARGVDAMKLVLPEDGLRAVRQAHRVAASDHRRRGRPICVIAAGREGSSSRCLNASAGLGWSYGRIRGSIGVDPGQPATALVKARQGAPFGVAPSYYAVVGARVEHSISPWFHNRVMQQAGHSGRFLDLSLASPNPALESSPDFELSGLAVTTPHKKWARSVAEPGDADQAKFPSWNTLRRDGDRWSGWNTDAPALGDLLSATGIGPPERVAVVGAGGVGMAAAIELRDRGYETVLTTRTAKQAEDLRSSMRLETRTDCPSDVVAIVNATGTDGPVPGSSCRADRVRVAVETRYLPQPTRFLAAWQDAGCQVVPGIRLFAEQARRQAGIWYGVGLSTREALRLADLALRAELTDTPFA